MTFTRSDPVRSTDIDNYGEWLSKKIRLMDKLNEVYWLEEVKEV